MSEEGLKDFLRKQARSLDSLLELTPAKNMFGEDVSDQWKRKKQTPEQKKAARMAKLDPANWKSAKDVYDERNAEAIKKRKREQSNGESQETSVTDQPAKKQRTDPASVAPPKSKPVEKLTERIDADLIGNQNLKKKMKKRAHRKEKNQQKREEEEIRKEGKQVTVNGTDVDSPQTISSKQSEVQHKPRQQTKSAQADVLPRREKHHIAASNKVTAKTDKPLDKMQVDASAMEDGPADQDEDAALSNVDAEDQDAEDEEMVDAVSTATSSEGIPEVLSPPQESAASSVSSIVPVSKTTPQLEPQIPQTAIADKPDTTEPTNAQTEAERQAARQRLQEQISQFRSQRKADDKPVRSRADLLAQRRQKDLERKTAKKEQRRKEKEEEAKKQDEEMAKRFSPGGSGSLLASPRSPMMDDGGGNAFTFGRIAFDDGTQFDAATGAAAANKKHKGPADPATALKAAQAKQARIAGLDAEKKQSIDEKDMWLNAKKRAHGERVKDDTSLLKKALKRQDKQKQRSGKEWDTRTEGIRSAQEAKQKRRTENLEKRRDEKKSGAKGGSKKSGDKKKVKRPGFEGSFRGRAGTGKSKKS